MSFVWYPVSFASIQSKGREKHPFILEGDKYMAYPADYKKILTIISISRNIQNYPPTKLLTSQNSPLPPMMSFSTPKQLPPQSMSAIQTAAMTRKR